MSTSPAARKRGRRSSPRAQMEGTRSLVLNGELILYGIVDPWDYSDTIRAIDVMASLIELDAQETIVVRLNSPGGSVIEGFAIYNALRMSGKPIEVHIDALAASIASVIAMAGDTIVMAENASLMIHDPYVAAYGGSDELRSAADEIDRLKGMMVSIYAGKTGLDAAEIEALMAAETYFSAEDAVAKGFATGVDKPLAIAACAKLGRDDLARLNAPLDVRAKLEPSPAALPAQSPRNETMPLNDKAAGEIAAAERTRVTKIFAAVRNAKLPLEFADELVDAGLSIEDAQTRITTKVAESSDPASVANVRAAAVTAERQRVQSIHSSVRAAKLSAEFADELIAAGVSVEEAGQRVIAKWTEVQAAADTDPVPHRGQIRISADEVEKWAEGATKGLLARAGLKGGERNEFSGLTLYELARSSLDIRNIKSGSMDRMSMVGTAFTARNAGPGYHSTSDFGSVLATAAYRSMMTGYEEVDETFGEWTSKGRASDFRPISRVDLGLFPSLDKVEEGAEYKYATIGDTGTTVQVATYGKMFSITRQAIVNDDLGFFDRVPRKMGRAAKRTIGNLVYAIVNSNPTMQDGVALYHASHGNLAAAAGVISVTSLGAARAAMARQKDEAGVGTAIGVRPKFILLPPELLDLALTVIGAEKTPGDAAGTPNAVRNIATPVSDSRLTGTAWHLAADPAQVDTIEVTYLDGVEEPFLDQRDGWGVDGSEFKVRMDAGVKALHWRGLYKNAGQ
ncbi:Clp protease ClpP [Kaistia dalseonensis]|uniref:ATP-dependent Clp protease proteolytic subunit n=1 Tax=Kaistia dalseonensis TaxID=410840 RepID=A0ABU0HAQ0_9HYPH|nr:head maturation protease, ClpP-related [Kaistia dalseonensis]MCX5496441.1 Clp protease ClpP [Kaistia dalseonensis]MDQ0439062.1 ATP-dependent protease ClpP protease subunit [Kaistia dalseonensis]